MNQPGTLGELRESGYTPRSVRAELRANLIERVRARTPLFPEMIGFADTVLPAIENAILAGTTWRSDRAWSSAPVSRSRGRGSRRSSGRLPTTRSGSGSSGASARSSLHPT